MEQALWQEPVTYGAVGATQAPDLFSHPPQGFRPVENRARIGHGDARFEYACAHMMSWGIQRGSGFRVEHDGKAALEGGDPAVLVFPIWKLGMRAPVRVVYLVDEPGRHGFAYGTLPGHPVSGEEAFVVNQREDGSVWLTVTAFSRPGSRVWWVFYPALRLAQRIMTRRYLRALAGRMG